MPIVKIIRNIYPDSESLYRVLDYVLHKATIVGGYAVDPEHCFGQMMFVKNAFHKTDGVQLKHFIISFSLSETINFCFDDYLRLGFLVGKFFEKYQMVYAVHLDADNLHMHFVMNTVSFTDGLKYSDGIAGFNALCNMLRDYLPGLNVSFRMSEHYDPEHPYCKDLCNE